ncbi:MAG: carboxylating nicotinate-nucleotide diphosphorylase [Bacteroidota bacterium]|jgi:nicotinate-nucleotide pyrophosphorylase (carboxylating)
MKPISAFLPPDELNAHILRSLAEDLGRGPEAGDHSSAACLDPNQQGIAQLKAKESLVLAGRDVVDAVLAAVDPGLRITWQCGDGDRLEAGRVAAEVRGPLPALLRAERTLLNYVQRLSGVATLTARYAAELQGLPCQLLDTRKTTPGWRALEKWAVQAGGGRNHRIGLFDMIMLKDNHIDLAGGITEAVRRTEDYLKRTGRNLAIEVECRSLADVDEALALPSVHRLMLDNFSPEDCRTAVARIAGRKETEASGGITLETLRSYAKTGVDFISVGALTHSARAVDLNFKVRPQ